MILIMFDEEVEEEEEKFDQVFNRITTTTTTFTNDDDDDDRPYFSLSFTRFDGLSGGLWEWILSLLSLSTDRDADNHFLLFSLVVIVLQRCWLLLIEKKNEIEKERESESKRKRNKLIRRRQRKKRETTRQISLVSSLLMLNDRRQCLFDDKSQPISIKMKIERRKRKNLFFSRFFSPRLPECACRCPLIYNNIDVNDIIEKILLILCRHCRFALISRDDIHIQCISTLSH